MIMIDAPTIELNYLINLQEWGSGVCANSNLLIRRNDFWMFTQPSITCSIWAAIWYQLKSIGFFGYVPLRPWKMQQWFRSNSLNSVGLEKLICQYHLIGCIEDFAALFHSLRNLMMKYFTWFMSFMFFLTHAIIDCLLRSIVAQVKGIYYGN